MKTEQEMNKKPDINKFSIPEMFSDSNLIQL